MAIKFNLNPDAIQIVADFIKRTDTYTGKDPNDYFTTEHNKAIEEVEKLDVTRHQFETIYELILDNFIEVNDEIEESHMIQTPPQNKMLEELKGLIQKYDLP